MTMSVPDSKVIFLAIPAMWSWIFSDSVDGHDPVLSDPLSRRERMGLLSTRFVFFVEIGAVFLTFFPTSFWCEFHQ